MITEKQFLDAVEIIKNYKIQIDEIINNSIKIQAKKTDFMDWVNNNDISVRLQKAITYNYNHGRIKYVEDLTKISDFLTLRQFGRKSIDEFFYIINNNK